MNPVRYQRGVAAVEAALAIALTMVLLPLLLYMGRLTWHAIVLHKAAYEAALIVSGLPETVFTSPGTAAVLDGIASSHVAQAVADAGIDIQPGAGVTRVSCDGLVCAFAKPAQINVATGITFDASFMGLEDGGPFGATAVTLGATYTVNYAP